MRSLCLVMSECSLSEQFLHRGLRKFGHSKSPVDRWYTQLDRRRFVYDTYNTMKATRTRHGWVHMFITHCLQLNLQLHNFDLFRTCTALLRGNWQDFNWHDASRGPSAIAELLVKYMDYTTASVWQRCSPLSDYFGHLFSHLASVGFRYPASVARLRLRSDLQIALRLILVTSLTWRSQLVVFFRFLTSSLRVAIVSALPTKPNRQSAETSATSTTSWNVWNAST